MFFLTSLDIRHSLPRVPLPYLLLKLELLFMSQHGQRQSCITQWFFSKKFQVNVNSGFYPAWLQSPKLGMDLPIVAGFDRVQQLSKAEYLKEASQPMGILSERQRSLKELVDLPKQPS